jgi:LysR family transcriptional regulator, glycine cleavage system transcriptional activator
VRHMHHQNGKLPLEEIEAFVEVAGAGSFSAAAERMNISHSSLSRKVAHLEDRIGNKLLQRKASGVELTARGAEHFIRFRDALNLIGTSLWPRHGTREDQAVRISMLESFAIFWLFPRHESLLRRAEGITLHYDLDVRLARFSQGIDLAVRFGMGQWPGTRAVRLHDLDYRPMACAAIAEGLGPDAPAESLLAHPLIHLNSEASWVTWFQANGVSYRLRPQDHVFSELPAALAAVQNGLGVGLSRLPISHLVDSGGILRHVSRVSFRSRSGTYLVRDGARPLRSPAARLAEALLAEAGVAEGAIAAFLAE